MRGTLRIVVLAALVRVAAFAFADNKHADAPIRALVAERMNREPELARDPRAYLQFGPLHVAAMRPFLMLDSTPGRGSRWLSLLCGVAVFVPFLRLARALGATDREASLAGLALALSPLHVQLSATAGSEALYTLLMVVALERLLAGSAALAGLAAGLAAVTRYDAWLALPALVAAALALRARPSRQMLLFAAVAALPPLGWLAWNAAATGDPFGALRFIAGDHAAIAARVEGAWGPWAGRGRQILVWVMGFAAAMTPLGAAAALRLRGLSREGRVLVAAALTPLVVYAVRGLLAFGFEPLPRFVMAPGVLLLALAAPALAAWPRGARRAAGAIAGASVAFATATTVLAAVVAPNGRIHLGTESLAPVPRLDGEDRALVQHLRAARRPGERVYLDPDGDFADIAVTAAAGIPSSESASLDTSRAGAPTFWATAALGRAAWVAVRDDSWAPRFGTGSCPDGTGRRFGRWRLFHIVAGACVP